MPNSTPESLTMAAELRTYLRNVLPDATLTEEKLDSQYEPLLLLLNKNALAAFAVANGNAEKSYEALYGGFKQHFAKQLGKWDALDVSFVFCVNPETQNLVDFCSRIETDVYFCRKFVVPLTKPLSHSLGRLPFLPLSSGEGPNLRPPSAQTFLQQCGLSAVLARYLVLPQERGPERIVDDCLGGEFGKPKALRPASNEKVSLIDHHSTPATLESISIQSFRAYKRTQTFTLGPDITVLYGPNGFGKTSFFDAIDFAMTGGIGRLGSISEARFKRAAEHLDGAPGAGRVSVSFRKGDVVRTITRNVVERKNGVLDGSTLDRKAILCEVAGSSSPAADRVDHLISLFRATHLFSQEHQELTNQFQDDCQLPADVVSRMLAFEDYTNATAKAHKVCDVLRDAIKRADSQVAELMARVHEGKKEIERLGKASPPATQVETLESRIEDLRQGLTASGIAVSDEPADVGIVRGWRAAIEASRAASQSRIDRLTELSTHVAALEQAGAEVGVIKQQLVDIENNFDKADSKRIAAEFALQQTEQKFAESKSKISHAQSTADLFSWIRAAKPEYLKMRGHIDRLDVEIAKATDALASLRAAEETADKKFRDQDGAAKLLGSQLQARNEDLGTLRRLLEESKPLVANQAHYAELGRSLAVELKLVDSLMKQEAELKSQLKPVQDEQARLSRVLAEADRDRTALSALITQFVQQVQGGVCPLCGENHGSRENLIQRIHKHIESDPVAGVRADFARLRERAQRLSSQLEEVRHQTQSAESRIKENQTDKAKFDQSSTQFATAVGRIGVDPGTIPDLQERLTAKQQQLETELVELSKLVQTSNGTLTAMRVDHANAKARVMAKESEIAKHKSTLERVRNEYDRLRNDPRLNQLSFEIPDDQVIELDRLNSESLAGYKTDVSKWESEVAQRKVEVAGSKQAAASLKEQVNKLRSQIASFQNKSVQVAARLEELHLPPGATVEHLRETLSVESKKHARLISLRDAVSNLELALDAATTAAALTQISANVHAAEKAVAHATARKEARMPWLNFFTDVSRRLQKQQSDAISSFTREYGPRTSVIQRRLRSVYGFDDIELQSNDSAIAVRVKRRGVDLRPTDYFSQSQQQTLLLGLFLTACSSQTWSSFSPVFLDDPVTHFDDLNTYAFLDLILGLIQSETGARQFIVSTCDEKLLMLAQQKFRRLGSRAKFYRFKAIGGDGPDIEEIH